MEVNLNDRKKAEELFLELEFRNIGDRLFGIDELKQSNNQSKESFEESFQKDFQIDLFSQSTNNLKQNKSLKEDLYHICDSPNQLEELIKNYSNENIISFQTVSSNAERDEKILGISLSLSKDTVYQPSPCILLTVPFCPSGKVISSSTAIGIFGLELYH